MMAASRGLQILGRGVPEVARTHLLCNKAWIAGQWVDAISGRTYPVYNPFNREIIAEVWRAVADCAASNKQRNSNESRITYICVPILASCTAGPGHGRG